MNAPSVPIDVDPTTGVWTTDGLPMIYLPRHFFINYHRRMEEALGEKRYREAAWKMGYDSAWQWCERESATHGLRGLAVFHHYLKRLSQRGWGQFHVERIDEATGHATIRLTNSIFVLGNAEHAARKCCYVFASWFCGALEWAARDNGASWKLGCEEVACAGEPSDDHCVFETKG
jgi:hypothetical protein